MCGEATNGEEAVRKSLEVNSELIILDVTMPVLDGFSAARKIKEAMRSSRSVGAQGFVTKAADQRGSPESGGCSYRRGHVLSERNPRISA